MHGRDEEEMTQPMQRKDMTTSPWASSSSFPLLLLFVCALPINYAQDLLADILPGDELCPFELHIWEDGSNGCEGKASSLSLIWADDICESNPASSGPGNYRAYCDEQDNIVFSVSGCRDDRCRTPSGKISMGEEECQVSNDDNNRIAPLYAATRPPQTPVNTPGDIPFICATLEGQISQVDTVSFALFGSCSNFNCSRPTAAPTASPAPTRSDGAPVVAPTDQEFYQGPIKVDCDQETSSCTWKMDECDIDVDSGTVTSSGSQGEASFIVTNDCIFSCNDCKFSSGANGGLAYGAFSMTFTILAVLWNIL